MTIASEHRKHIPLGVKLHACLILLGFTDEEISGGIQWDHEPALALRFVNPETGEMEPHPNDPHFLRPLANQNHRFKSCGRRGEKRVTSAGSDVHKVAKLKRLTADQEEMRRRLLAKEPGQRAPRKNTIPSRGFAKGHRKFGR